MFNIYVGTSGWGYDEWIGPFYPRGLANKDFLSYYSGIFYTNEINTTFYNIPSKSVVDSWAKCTPSDFVFSAKLPQVITHKNKLDVDKIAEDLNYFLDVMNPLTKAEKLMAFLIQLPPSFRKENHFQSLKEFIENWPQDREKEGYHLVVEFRHPSWMSEDVFNYLKRNQLTYCGVIEPLLPPRMDITNPELGHIRFHGFGKKIWFNYLFSESEIKKWAIRVREIVQDTENIGIYFNNHFSGYAAKNSLMMMRELNQKPRNDPKTIKIFEIKKKSGSLSENQTSLDKFF